MKNKFIWWDKVWNPVTGCTKVSAGCRECYAKTLHDMRHKAYLEGKKLPGQYSTPFEEVRCHENRKNHPFEWRKPQRVFVNSMSDLFHPDVPFEFIFEIYWTMMNLERHTFMILTKRPERAIEFFSWWDDLHNKPTGIRPFWDYKNIWLGVSIENQEMATERIPLLLQTPAAVRFISVEPLLAPIDFHLMIQGKTWSWNIHIDWVICGGESGKNPRPMHPDWARSLRDQCKDAGVPFFFKQWGEFIPINKLPKISTGEERLVTYDGKSLLEMKTNVETNIAHEKDCWMKRVGKKKAGRLLDGVEHNACPVIGGEFPKIG